MLFKDRKYEVLLHQLITEKNATPVNRTGLCFPEYYDRAMCDLHFFNGVASRFVEAMRLGQPLNPKFVKYVYAEVQRSSSNLLKAEQRRLREIEELNRLTGDRNAEIFTKYSELIDEFIIQLGGATYPNPHIYKNPYLDALTPFIDDRPLMLMTRLTDCYLEESFKLVNMLAFKESIEADLGFSSSLEQFIADRDGELTYHAFEIQILSQANENDLNSALNAYSKLPASEIGRDLLNHFVYRHFNISMKGSAHIDAHLFE